MEHERRRQQELDKQLERQREQERQREEERRKEIERREVRSKIQCMFCTIDSICNPLSVFCLRRLLSGSWSVSGSQSGRDRADRSCSPRETESRRTSSCSKHARKHSSLSWRLWYTTLHYTSLHFNVLTDLNMQAWSYIRCHHIDKAVKKNHVC